MRKISRPLPAIVFALLCLVPLALFTVDGPWPGAAHMRLQPREPFPDRITPKVFRAFDRWFASRIGLRLPLLATGAAFHTGLLRRSTDRRVAIGRDGWLFWTDSGDNNSASMADFRGQLRLTEAEVKAIDRRALAMHDTLAACGVSGLIAVAPNKQSIYGEFLNNSTVQPKTRLDDLLTRLDPRARKTILDLREPLRAAKAQDPSLPLYFKTDTHWNELGAFYAYRAIVNALATTMPIGNLSSASLDQFTIERQPFDSGDLAVSMLSAREWFSDVQVKLRRKTDGMTAGAGSMLLIGDSFSDLLKGYFSPHFAEFRFATHDNIPADPPRGRPSAVVFEIVERALPDLTKLNFDWTQFCPR